MHTKKKNKSNAFKSYHDKNIILKQTVTEKRKIVDALHLL